MRAFEIALWLLAAVILLRPLVRARRIGTPPVERDELVKDPVCHTYVVRSRAITRDAASGPAYFCSAECARRYAAQV